jgi:tetratricopeptide (TPR) repeat protein
MFASLLLASVISIGITSDVDLADPNGLAALRTSEITPGFQQSKLALYRQEADREHSAKSLEALRKLALEYLKMHRKAESIATCRELLDTYELSNALGRAVISVAHMSYEAGDYTTARTIHNMVVEKWPEGDISVRARKELVLMDIAVVDDSALQNSLESFCRAHENRRDSVVENAFVNVGKAYMEARGDSGAMPFCRRIMAKWPASQRVRVAFEPADLLLAGDIDRESRLGRLLQDSNSTSRSVVAAVAGRYMKGGQREKAYALCNRLIKTAPGSEAAGQAIALKAKMDIGEGNISGGATAFSKLKSSYSASQASASALVSVAESYRAAARDPEARSVYDYTSQKWAATPAGSMAAAGSAVVSGQTVCDLRDRVNTCLAAPDPNGRMFGRLFLEGIALQGDAIQRIADGNSVRGRALMEKSMTVFEALYAQSPTSHKGACRLAIAECYRQQGMYNEAIAEYERSLRESPMGGDASVAQFMVGECYRMLVAKKAIDEIAGEEKMRGAYRSVLRNYPGGPMAKAAAARLRVAPVTAEGGAR